MTTSKLKYTCQPNQAFVKKVATFTIHGKNAGKSPVTFEDSDFIEIKVPQKMVADYGPDPTVPPGKGYIVTKTEIGDYVVTFPDGATIHKDEEVEVIFGQVTVVSDPVDANIDVYETFKENKVETSLGFEVKELKPGLIAWIDKSVLSEYGFTYLNWESVGASAVTVSGFPDKGITNVPIIGRTKIYFPKDSPTFQVNYLIEAWAGNKIIGQKTIPISRIPPQLYYFKTDPETKSVKSPNTVKLIWRANFATSIIMTTPTIPNSRQRVEDIQGELEVNPAKDLYDSYSRTWSQLPAYAEYFLTVNGFKKVACLSVKVNVEPTELIYFKYEEPAFKGGVLVKYDPEEYTGTQRRTGPGDTIIFELFQPGGKSNVYYLGTSDSVHPQIQYFDFVKKDSLFNLSWQSHNCTKLALTLADCTTEEIKGASIISGKKDGVPAGQYKLLGTAADGSTIVSILEVTSGSS